MLDELETGEPMLFVIDEILKGTNTRERLAASNAILSYMVQKQGFLLIATHDLELVYALKNRYDTYYFDSQVHEKDIVFPYKIRRGIVGKTNAIDLMELLDFQKKLQTRHGVRRERDNCIFKYYRRRNGTDENRTGSTTDRINHQQYPLL